jgi:NADPH:quinone reductase-like Zn-dependent oxidoreductase
VIWHKVLGLFRNHSVKTFLMNSIAADCQWMADHFVKGELNVLIDSTYPLDQTAKAHERSESGRARGKIIIRIK